MEVKLITGVVNFGSDLGLKNLTNLVTFGSAAADRAAHTGQKLVCMSNRIF